MCVCYENYANLHRDDYNAAGFIFISTSVGNIVILIFFRRRRRRLLCRLLLPLCFETCCSFFFSCYYS